MFALALALLAILQTTAIPPLNEQHEFQHHQRVQDDMIELHGAVGRTAVTGGRASVKVDAGLRYPPRMLFVNPPVTAGTIRTTEPAVLDISNALAGGEAGDYWNGSPKEFETRSLVYSADYHEYTDAPDVIYDSWTVNTRTNGSAHHLTDPDFVNGRRVTLITLGGQVSTSTTRDKSIPILPSSAPANVVTVRGDGDPLTLTIPTRLTEDDWDTLLDDELDPDGDPTNDRYVTEINCLRSPPSPCERLTIELEEGVGYELRLGKVSIGRDDGEPDGAYIVDTTGDDTSVPENGSQKIIVEVRDRFDNPVSDVTVNTSLTGIGTVRTLTPETGSDGKAAFVYEAPEGITHTQDVEVTASFGSGTKRESAILDIRVMDLGGAGSGNSAPSVTIRNVDARTRGDHRYDVSVDTDDPDGDLSRVVFELRNPDTGAVVDTTSTTISGATASVTEELRATGNDRLSEYRLHVEVFDDAGGTGSDERIVSGSG